MTKVGWWSIPGVMAEARFAILTIRYLKETNPDYTCLFSEKTVLPILDSIEKTLELLN